jgi:type I restriction enzyme S subunit
MKDVMVSQAQGGAQPNISQIKIKNLQIYFPSLDIQREIVAKVEAVKARCERLKAEAERGLKAAEALRKAVLAEAFEQ